MKHFILYFNTILLLLPCISWGNPIIREDILNRANQYANYEFYANNQNITPNTGEFLQDKLVITSISSPGFYTGIPYKWGGNDSIDSFQRGLDNGKKVGDICKPTVQNGYRNIISNQAIGVDSSGLISQVWGLPRKYSTKYLPTISNKLPSLNDLKGGDIILKQ